MTTIAIVPRGLDLPEAERSLIASAINLQVTRDFTPAWNIQGTVTTFPDDSEPLARGFVPVYVVADSGGSDGVHRHPDNGILFALVRYSPGLRWSLPASHEVLELLVDPTLNYTLPGPLRGQPSVTVQYLVEICDPCESPDYAYQVDDAHKVYVSDFCLPSYYWKSPSPTAPFTFKDSVSGPGMLCDGGRITWRDASGVYFQRTRVGGPERTIGNLTEAQIFGDDGDRKNLRGAIDRHGFGAARRRGALRPLAPRHGARKGSRKTSNRVQQDMDRFLRQLLRK